MNKTEYSREQTLLLLKRHFGYSTLRPGQEDVIKSITEGLDTIVIMPTGGGKSMCYQLPALLRSGLALVISPLIALMKDQVDALTRADIAATFINSSLSFREIQLRLQQARLGAYRLIYLAPERLASPQFIERLQQLPISFLAVDEAHCISEWGHDFRTSYLRIPAFNDALGRLPVIALTATATAEVQNDIIKHLALRRPQKFVFGFDRPNLRYLVESGVNKSLRVAEICAASRGSNIVYCGSRKKVDEMAETLIKNGQVAAAYHAGLPDRQRRSVQEDFLSGAQSTIVATNAFGMGVDKANVRNVIHCDLPLTLEAYYQESGRAGRDGLPSDSLLLYERQDRKLPEFFIGCTYPAPETIEKVYTLLYEIHGTRIGARSAAPVALDDAQIGNRLGLHKGLIGGAIAFLERENILRRGFADGRARLQFTTTRERLQEYYRNTRDPVRQRVLVALLRTVGAESLSRPAEFSVTDVLVKQDVREDELLTAMRAFQYARLLKFEPAGSSAGLSLLLERMPVTQLPADLKGLAERRDRALQKLQTVIRYAETPQCKRNFLLSYFTEPLSDDTCDICSSCTAVTAVPERRSKRRNFLLQCILSCTAELNNRFGRNVLADVVHGNSTAKVQSFELERAPSFGAGRDFTRAEVLEEIDSALGEGFVAQSAELHPTISLTAMGREQMSQPAQPVHFRRVPKQKAADPVLAAACKALRREIARREGLSERAVLDDPTLDAVVRALPETNDALAAIDGIGPVFVNRHGADFLHIVRQHIAAERSYSQVSTSLPSRVRSTLAAARKGASLQQVATERGLSISTIARHLQEAIEAGARLERDSFVSEQLFFQVRDYLSRHSHASLREIRAAISGDCDFADLRLAAAFARRELTAEKI